MSRDKERKKNKNTYHLIRQSGKIVKKTDKTDGM